MINTSSRAFTPRRRHARKTSEPIKITSRSRRDWDSFRSLREFSNEWLRSEFCGLAPLNFQVTLSDYTTLLKFLQLYIFSSSTRVSTKYNIIYILWAEKERCRFNFTSITSATPSHSRQHLRRVITSATVVMFPNVVSRASSALPSKELPRVGTIHPPCDSFSKSRLQMADVSERIAGKEFARSVVTAFKLTTLIHGRVCNGRV